MAQIDAPRRELLIVRLVKNRSVLRKLGPYTIDALKLVFRAPVTSKTPAGRHATEGCLGAFFAGGLLGLALGVALPRRTPLRAVCLVRRGSVIGA